MSDLNKRQNFVHLILILLGGQLVYGFEENYERRNAPNDRYYEASERFYNRDRFETNNRRPTSVFMSLRQNDGDRYLSQGRRRGGFGNGYDNLANDEFPSRINFFREGSIFNERDNFRTNTNNRRFMDQRRSRPESLDSRKSPDFFGSSEWITDRRVNRPTNGDRRGDYRINDSFRDESHLEDRGLPGDYEGDATRQENWKTLESGPIIDRRRVDHNFESSRGYRPNNQRKTVAPFYQRDYFVTKPGRSSSSYETENSDKDYQSSSGGKEISGLSTVGSYISTNEDKNQKRTDSGYTNNKEGAKTDVENSEKIGESTRIDKNGGNKSSVRSNKTLKKGHSTKGFATHHHKDETGNTTTFFDESTDHGGQSEYQDLEDEFGTRRTMEILNGKEDGRFFRENGGRTGNFGSGFLKDNKKSEKDVIAKDDRFNKEEIFGKGEDHVDRGFKAASEYLGGGIWEESRPI